jgi:hypothetical protein
LLPSAADRTPKPSNGPEAGAGREGAEKPGISLREAPPPPPAKEDRLQTRHAPEAPASAKAPGKGNGCRRPDLPGPGRTPSRGRAETPGGEDGFRPAGGMRIETRKLTGKAPEASRRRRLA